MELMQDDCSGMMGGSPGWISEHGACLNAMTIPPERGDGHGAHGER